MVSKMVLPSATCKIKHLFSIEFFFCHVLVNECMKQCFSLYTVILYSPILMFKIQHLTKYLHKVKLQRFLPCTINMMAIFDVEV